MDYEYKPNLKGPEDRTGVVCGTVAEQPQVISSLSQLDLDILLGKSKKIVEGEKGWSGLRLAPFFLEEALTAMKDRAASRDCKDSGERSMAKTVALFNLATGTTLTEEQGWLFMVLLKIVRGLQGDFREDDYIDLSAYGALMGEAASKERGKE